MIADADLVVVGGGPVGQYAALKAAVLNHPVVVVDKGAEFSRVSQAPALAALPGRPGISGRRLLEEGWDALRHFGELRGEELVRVLDGEAIEARREADGRFLVRVRTARGEAAARGRALVLATGMVDRKPGIGAFHRRGHATLAPWLARGHVGYCILCEGWSLDGKRVGVVGCTDESVQVAVDLKQHFGASPTLLTDGIPVVEKEAAAKLAEAGVPVDGRPVDRVTDEGEGVRADFAEGAPATFDKLFFTLGIYKVNNELAVQLGAKVTAEGFVVTDENSEVVGQDGRLVQGLFAVGDLRAGRWKQVVAGWGDADTAVTTAYAWRLSS